MAQVAENGYHIPHKIGKSGKDLLKEVPKRDIRHPLDDLKDVSKSEQCALNSLQFATYMDEKDPQRKLRKEFCYPKNKTVPHVDLSVVNGDDECVYFCGNSLGLMPKGVQTHMDNQLKKWSQIGVYGHSMGELPWAHCDECVTKDMAKLVGAREEEVAVMNGLTINEHLQLISFYKPTPQRHKILFEAHAFPSDHYCVESQIRLRGYDPEKSMICMEPRLGEHTLRTEDILEVIEKQGDEIAVILFSGVQYYTGQYFDIETITKAGQAKGCYVGWDLAHAAGNVDLCLHDWNVDFACWCSYKYINTGAGGIAGFFIHERHFGNKFDKLHGWWSHKMETRFQMTNSLEESEGASCYRVSNPPFMLCASLRASLDVFEMTTIQGLREKSKLLTAYLEYLLLEQYPPPSDGEECSKPFVRIITPEDPDRRGAMLSVMFSVPVTKVHNELKKRGCVVDKREPNVLRVAPAPLYNSFTDVYKFVRYLGDALYAAAV